MPACRYHEDSRDGKVYKCVLMPDGKWWAAENLAWEGAGRDYDDNALNRPIYGRLYTQGESIALCPVGAHLPSGDEWRSLAASVDFAPGAKLKSQTLWNVYEGGGNGTDDYGFSAKPGGEYYEGYSSLGKYGSFWTSYASGTPGYGGYIFLSCYDGALHDSETISSISMSARFIVDTFNTPSNFKLFGCDFQGFDRDATVTITRQIQVQESEGGSVTLIPTAPAQFDSWDIEVGLRVSSAQAQAIEASLPPYGTPSENALRLPPRGGGASFPGLLPLTPGETYDLYAYPMASPLDVQGRVAIGTDLFSYRMSLRFFAAHLSATNAPTAITTTAPEWLTGKAITHSVADPSASIPTIIVRAPSVAVNTNFHPTKQGRTNRRAITLDCLSQDRSDELVGFFRGVRHNPTTIALDNGANGFEAVSVYLAALSFTRGDGLYWTGSLEVVLA